MPSQRHHLHPPFVQNQKPSPAHPRKQRLSLRLTSPRSRRPLQDATRTATSSVVSNSNGVLQRLSGMDSPSPSPSDSEDSEAGSASMARAVPPTHPQSFSISSSNTTTATAATSGSTLPHCLLPLSTYRPRSSYVPPSVCLLPSGTCALHAGLGIGVDMGGYVAVLTCHFINVTNTVTVMQDATCKK